MFKDYTQRVKSFFVPKLLESRTSQCPNAPPFFGNLGPTFYYGIVRYLYMRSDPMDYMSQVLAKPKIHKTGLIQDLYVVEEKSYLPSSACAASCYVCDKGLKDGYSLTANIISGETVLLCDIHNSKNY